MKGFILVTGTSTGIGEAIALQLSQVGYTVFAGVRKEKDAESLKTKSQYQIIPIMLDVCNPEQVVKAFELIKNTVGKEGLKAIINNAGINYVFPTEYYDEVEARQLFEVNFWGVASLCKTFLPLLRIHASQYQKSAKILNVGSIGSVSAMPFISFYNAAKFALLGLSESLRLEMNPHDIQVSVILPGGVKTNIWEKTYQSIETATVNLSEIGRKYHAENIKKTLSLAGTFEKYAVTSEQAAQVFIKVLENPNPKLKYTIGFDANLLYFLTRFIPTSWRHYLLRTQLGF